MSNLNQRSQMPAGTNSVLDRRTVVNANANLLSLVQRGDRVLDVGCGSGAITRDIAALVGPDGLVIGIDTSAALIAQARATHTAAHLYFEVGDISNYTHDNLFDVVTSARVLQWLSDPARVVQKMSTLVRPGGCLTILDYNHTKVEFSPAIPDTMKVFYDAFLQWRGDAGMDNAIADHLEDHFRYAGLQKIITADHSEVSIRGQREFHEDVSIWLKVAELRGPQVVADGYISDSARLAAMEDYTRWVETKAEYMRLYLRAVTGYRHPKNRSA